MEWSGKLDKYISTEYATGGHDDGSFEFSREITVRGPSLPAHARKSSGQQPLCALSACA